MADRQKQLPAGLHPESVDRKALGPSKETVNKHGSPPPQLQRSSNGCLGPGARIQESEFVAIEDSTMGVFVGIDVSKQHLDWVVGAEGKVERAPNSPGGARQLVARLSKIELAS